MESLSFCAGIFGAAASGPGYGAVALERVLTGRCLKCQSSTGSGPSQSNCRRGSVQGGLSLVGPIRSSSKLARLLIPAGS